MRSGFRGRLIPAIAGRNIKKIGQNDQGNRENFDFQVSRPLFRIYEPSPDKCTEERPDEDYNCDVYGFFQEMIKADQEPFDDFDEQPPAGDKRRQSLDDPAFSESISVRGED